MQSQNPASQMRFSSVEESQFGKLLIQFRERISTIKQKYAGIQDDSLERKQADRQVELLESMLDTAQQSILPQFDNGSTKLSYASLLYYGFPHRNDYIEFESAELKIMKRVMELLPDIFAKAKAESFTGSMTLYVSVYLKKYFHDHKDDFFQAYVKTPGRDLQRFVADLQHYITACSLYKDPNHVDSDNLKLKNRLFRPNAYLPYTFDVGHRMIFEMLIETTKLANEISDDLREFLSFLNPAMLALDFSSGFTGSLMTRFARKVAKVEHVRDYDFRFIEMSVEDDSTVTYEFNAATIYSEFKQFVFSFLLSGIHIYISNVDDRAAKAIYDHFMQGMQHYFDTNKDTAKVKSDLARTELLLAFIQKETTKHSDAVAKITAASKSDDYLFGLKGQELVDALRAELDNDQQKFLCANQLIDLIQNIRRSRFDWLLQQQPSMQASIDKFRKQGVDMSFLRAPPPLHAFHRVNNQLTIVPMMAALQERLYQLYSELNFDRSRYAKLRAWAHDPATIPKTKRGDTKMRANNMVAVDPQVPSTIDALRSDIEKLTERHHALTVKDVLEVAQARSKIKVTLAEMIQLTNPTIDVATTVDDLVNDGEALNHWLLTAVDSFGLASESGYYKRQLEGILARINNRLRFDWATYDHINQATITDKFLELVGATDAQIDQWKSCQTKDDKKAAIAMIKPLITQKMATIDEELLTKLASNKAYARFYELKMMISEECKLIIDFDNKTQLALTLNRARLIEQSRVKLASYSERFGMSQVFVEMDNFIQTGDQEELLAALFAARDNFINDTQFRTLINQVITALHDFDRDAKLLDYQALRITAETSDKTPQIQALYHEIQVLEQSAKRLFATHQADGLQIQGLAKMLRRDVDCHLAGHSDDNFLELFKARLHSQDMLMEKHKSILPVIANIALLVLSVLTAGVVAAARVGYSKLTTGKFTFFVNTDSALQQQAAAIVRSAPAA